MVESGDESQTRNYILEKIQLHVPEWSSLKPEDIKATKLSGLSNIAYRVKIESEEHKDLKPQLLLFRVFKCEIVDFRIENSIFQAMSDEGTGPKCYFQCKEYRVEEFFVSRPISIFEMRVDHFLKAYAIKICDFNHSKTAQDRVEAIRSKERTFFEEMELWSNKLKEQIPRMKAVVKNEEYLKVIQEVEQEYLQEGNLEELRRLSHLDYTRVVCHCDAQENNILSSLENPMNIMLIDLEYANWGPMSLDIANYINETMLDNAYPLKNGINYYLDNLATEQEQEVIMLTYLNRYGSKFLGKEGQELEAYVREELPILKPKVKDNLVVNNSYWGIWALMMLKEEDWDKEGVFNYDFAKARVEMTRHVKNL